MPLPTEKSFKRRRKKLEPVSQKASSTTTYVGAGHCQQHKAATDDEESFNRPCEKLQSMTTESYGDDGEDAAGHRRKLQAATKKLQPTTEDVETIDFCGMLELAMGTTARLQAATTRLLWRGLQAATVRLLPDGGDGGCDHGSRPRCNQRRRETTTAG